MTGWDLKSRPAAVGPSLVLDNEVALRGQSAPGGDVGQAVRRTKVAAKDAAHPVAFAPGRWTRPAWRCNRAWAAEDGCALAEREARRGCSVSVPHTTYKVFTTQVPGFGQILWRRTVAPRLVLSGPRTTRRRRSAGGAGERRRGELVRTLGNSPADARAAAATHTLTLKNGRWTRHSAGPENSLDCGGVYLVVDNNVTFNGDPLPNCNYSAGSLLSAVWTMRGPALTLHLLGGVDAYGFDQMVWCTKSWHRIADPPSGNEMRR